MFTVHNFADIDTLQPYIQHNIISLSYTDLTKKASSLAHSHPYTEIMIVAEGNGQLVSNRRTIPFCKGVLYIVNPNTEHLESSNGSLQYYVVKLDCFTVYQTDKLSEIVTMKLDYGAEKNLLTRLQQTLDDCNLKDELRKTLLPLDLAYLYYYFSHLLDGYDIRRTAIQRKSSAIQAVVDYISSNYALDLKISEIAAKFAFSHNNLLYHFRKELGTTPNEFIIAKRIQVAKWILKSTDHSIIQIATLCGFSHPSFFSKTFKKSEGITPTEYRKKLKTE